MKNTLLAFSFRLPFLFVSLSFETSALAFTCESELAQKVENCKSLSIKVKESCEFVAQEKIDQKALDLLKSNSITSPREAGRGLLVLTGAKNTNFKIDLAAEIKRCEYSINDYKGRCRTNTDELNTCMASTSADSDTVVENRAGDLTAGILEAEENLTTSQGKLSQSEVTIEKLDIEIKKNVATLCKQDQSSPASKDGCEQPSAEFTSKALQSFSICSPSDDRYNRDNCRSVVMPSVEPTGETFSASVKASTATEISPPPIQRSIAGTEVAQLSVKDSVDKPVAARTQPPSTEESGFEPTKPSKTSEFTSPSFSTIAKYALLATLAYGVVTGKIRTWIDKVATALNPLAKKPTANTGVRNTASAAGGTASGGCTGRYNGRIDPPEQSIRLANRARQLREGNGLGGGVDGGIYLEGAFEFKTGPLVNGACQLLPGSRAIIHGTYTNLSGSIKADKSFAFSHEGGPVNGSVNGSAITGRLAEGGGREWVYGVLVGNFTPN